MPAEIFRAAVDYDVSAKCQRTLQIRREESVIDDRELVVLFRDPGNCFDIGDREKRICGSLNVDSFNVIVYCILDCLKIGCVYDLVCDAEVLENVIEYAECTAVDIVSYDELVAALEK